MKTPILVVARAALISLSVGSSGVASSTNGFGSKIAFTADRVGRDAPDEVYVMNGDGTDERASPQRRLVNALFPKWSPNGQLIAFHDSTAETGGPEIFLVNDDGTGLTRLTHTAELGLGAVNASWAPDGKRLVFNSAVKPDLYLVGVDRSGLTRLTDDPANEARPDWSPDGRRIAFNSNRGGNVDIYVMNADGTGDPLRLTTASGNGVGARWSPNGRQLAFESTRDGNREIYVMNADGTDQLRLTFDARIDSFPSSGSSCFNATYEATIELAEGSTLALEASGVVCTVGGFGSLLLARSHARLVSASLHAMR